MLHGQNKKEKHETFNVRCFILTLFSNTLAVEQILL